MALSGLSFGEDSYLLCVKGALHLQPLFASTNFFSRLERRLHLLRTSTFRHAFVMSDGPILSWCVQIFSSSLTWLRLFCALRIVQPRLLVRFHHRPHPRPRAWLGVYNIAYRLDTCPCAHSVLAPLVLLFKRRQSFSRQDRTPDAFTPGAFECFTPFDSAETILPRYVQYSPLLLPICVLLYHPRTPLRLFGFIRASSRPLLVLFTVTSLPSPRTDVHKNHSPSRPNKHLRPHSAAALIINS